MSVDLIRFIIFVAILGGLALVALTIPAFRPYLRKNPAVAFLLTRSSFCGRRWSTRFPCLF